MAVVEAGVGHPFAIGRGQGEHVGTFAIGEGADFARVEVNAVNLEIGA
jgi:hypothetical protein